MARKMYVSEDMGLDDGLVEISDTDLQSALLWPWFLPHFDDWGRMEANARRIRGKIFPNFDGITIEDIERALKHFAAKGLAALYEVDGKRFMAVDPDKWFDYQSHIHKSKRDIDLSRIPAPPVGIFKNPPRCSEECSDAPREIAETRGATREHAKDSDNPRDDAKNRASVTDSVTVTVTPPFPPSGGEVVGEVLGTVQGHISESPPASEAGSPSDAPHNPLPPGTSGQSAPALGTVTDTVKELTMQKRREFPPKEPAPEHQPAHLIWRVEMLNEALIPKGAIGREVKAASDMFQAGYSEDEIFGHYRDRRESWNGPYTLHHLKDHIYSLKRPASKGVAAAAPVPPPVRIASPEERYVPPPSYAALQHQRDQEARRQRQMKVTAEIDSTPDTPGGGDAQK